MKENLSNEGEKKEEYLKGELVKRRRKERRVFEGGIGEEKKQVKTNLKTHFPAKHGRGGGAERIDSHYLLTNLSF